MPVCYIHMVYILMYSMITKTSPLKEIKRVWVQLVQQLAKNNVIVNVRA